MKKNRAFTLLELSISILIIGLLVSAFLGGADLATDAKLRQARNLTQNSPAPGISNLVLWLDTVSERSFLEKEAIDGAAVSRWNNLSPEASSSSYLSNNSETASDHPIYKESCINGLPCLYFGGGSSNKITAQRSFGVRSKYLSLFVVFVGSKTSTATYSNFFVSDKDLASDSASSAFSFSGEFGGGFSYYISSTYGIPASYCNSNVNFTKDQPYIYSLVDDNSSTIYQYVNGVKANDSAGNGAISKLIGSFEIGTGRNQTSFGEVIVFTKALTASERKSVEQYLAKKWGISVAS
jgi:prepilin-type N-terminal cleavage/methylation domain-containing protein